MSKTHRSSRRARGGARGAGDATRRGRGGDDQQTAVHHVERRVRGASGSGTGRAAAALVAAVAFIVPDERQGRASARGEGEEGSDVGFRGARRDQRGDGVRAGEAQEPPRGPAVDDADALVQRGRLRVHVAVVQRDAVVVELGAGLLLEALEVALDRVGHERVEVEGVGGGADARGGIRAREPRGNGARGGVRTARERAPRGDARRRRDRGRRRAGHRGGRGSLCDPTTTTLSPRGFLRYHERLRYRTTPHHHHLGDRSARRRPQTAGRARVGAR